MTGTIKQRLDRIEEKLDKALPPHRSHAVVWGNNGEDVNRLVARGIAAFDAVRGPVEIWFNNRAVTITRPIAPEDAVVLVNHLFR